jgi:capsular exopolysaccharide synthesis family protein
MSLIVIAVGIYSKLQTPLYRAKAILEIDLPYRSGGDSATQPSYWRSRDPFMKTQFRLLSGKDLSNRVAEKLHLSLADLKYGAGDSAHPERKNPSAAETRLVAAELLDMLQIKPVPDTTLCEIYFSTPDPKLSMILAETWAEEYVNQHVDSMHQYTRKASELLSEQVLHLQKEIAEKEKLLFDYSVRQNIIKPDKSRSMAATAVTDINSAINNATRERISAEVRVAALKSSSPDSIPDVSGHPSVQKVQSQLIDLERQYREKSKIFKPDYPEMIRIRSELDNLESTLQATKLNAYQEVLGGARSELQRAYSSEAALKKQLETASLKTVEVGRKELEYDNLVLDIENKKLLLTSLLQKQNETDVSAKVQNKTTSTWVIERPELPKSIFKPNIQKNLFLAVLSGLILGMGLAVGLEFFDRSIRSAEDVESVLRLPFLGIVPRYATMGEHGHKNGSKMPVKKGISEVGLDLYKQDLLSAIDPQSDASEAMKTIRTSVLLASPGAPPRSILITSSRAGEGKTFIACNLAIALTQLDKRVVLIDADMRNPRVHRIWNANNDIGLSLYLTGDVPISSVLRASTVNHLFYISSGPKTPRPAELLASAKFESLLQQLQKEYDFVILDSPPVLPVADSVILASRAEAVLLVVFGGETPRDVIKMAKKKLLTSNAVIIGTVVNGIDFSDPYYYYRYYSSYSYGYYGDSRSSKEA